ncbi:hypothetical protein ABKS89_24445 [Pseudomonas sp. LABIM340]|uniref:hypothetical protein n=1 Tax=Pseudomonas sp. LABIM340 TaxID=3156585 RepID=UPI0032AFC0B8
MMKTPVVLCFALALAGCATKKTDVRNEAEIAKFDPETTARIRLITGDGVKGGFASGLTCETVLSGSSSRDLRIHDAWRQAHLDGPGIAPWRDTDSQNTSVGVPASSASKEINSTRKQYDEYVVPANQTLIVQLAAVGSYTCDPSPLLVTPEPGRNYEFQLEYFLQGISGKCAISAKKLDDLAGVTVEVPLRTKLCSRAQDGKFVTVDPLQVGLEKPTSDTAQKQ